MKVYNIKFTESRTAYFGVEAASEEEALKRFEEWRVASDYIYSTLDNDFFNIENNAEICDNAVTNEDDILTDKEYRNL